MTSPGAAPEAGAVRRASQRDLDRLVAMWVAEAEHHAPLDALFRLRSDAEARLRRMLEADLRAPDAAVFVADAAGDLTGFACVRIARAPPIFEEVERAEISDLFVRAAARRRGTGRALAGACLAWVRRRGVARAEVRVASANREGQAFWRALGFSALMDVLDLRL